jgi:hypothetical protein
VEHQLSADQIVDQYLHELNDFLRTVQVSDRRDFVADITQHIEQSRSLTGSDDPMATRRLLERLGTPRELATEFLKAQPTIPVRDLDKATPWFLALGGIFIGVGWLFGLYGVWTSNVWGWKDKVLGSMIWPTILIGYFWAEGNRDGSVCGSGIPRGSCGGIGASLPLIGFLLIGVAIFFRLLWILYRRP